jgi:hypothetical protein
LLCIESQLTIAQTCRNTTIETEVSELCKRVAITNIAKAGLRQICTLTTVTDPEFTAFLTQIKACRTPEINTFFATFGSNLPNLTIIVKDAILVDMWRPNPTVTNTEVLKTYKSISGVLSHIKFREASTARDIKGCHDIIQWNNPAVIRQQSLLTSPSYTVPIGLPLTDSRVPEVVIISNIAHSSTPAIRIVDYRVPAVDARVLTTGVLKGGNPFQKTLYDPLVWTDVKLEKALRTAFNNAIVSGTVGMVATSGSRKFSGITSDGYAIEGYYIPATFTFTTFYFK